MVTATILCFFAAISGCADAGMDRGLKPAGALASICSFMAWILTLAAYCLWSSFPYVAGIQATNPTVQVPIWINQAQNLMTSIPVYDAWFGAGWATALTA